jgi:hypothetical protein
MLTDGDKGLLGLVPAAVGISLIPVACDHQKNLTLSPEFNCIVSVITASVWSFCAPVVVNVNDELGAMTSLIVNHTVTL